MANLKLTKIIETKRNGGVLSTEDVSYFVKCVIKSISKEEGAADRSQIGAMLMAIYLKGLNDFETAELTMAMTSSSNAFVWPESYKDFVVDKHSTGGVGDKISLILAPVLAALGLKVPMVSGRSLGHTGGTLDKLESIPGYRVSLTKQEIQSALENVGCCIVGQTEDCAPADKVLYHCREITATVDCASLIISSISSKKLSEGLNSLVYDVKYGKGSVFKSKEEALDTAKSLVNASKSVDVVALLTSMENPLGRNSGNSLEVLESIECLRGGGPDDILQLVTALGAELLHSTKHLEREVGAKHISEALKNGEALKKFYDMITFQGVSKSIAHELCYGDSSQVLRKAPYQTNITYSGFEGYIENIDPLKLANIWKEEEYISQNNPGIGFTLLKAIGDKICKGDAWLQFHHHQSELLKSQERELHSAITVCSGKVERKLIDRRIYYEGDYLVVKEL
ncbi:thymidine phosphorylase-like [Parasteatoda tepidariorum]|uniref:thymidine phosphorylase-like n=1 Tax=Parasteatoda tepidariorum TaxID=114398 RepID=UPI0039BC9308